MVFVLGFSVENLPRRLGIYIKDQIKPIYTVLRTSPRRKELVVFGQEPIY